MELTTTLAEFMEKFGGKDASEFEERLESEYYNYHYRNLNGKYYLLLWNNFCNLSEEEKLKFTVEQAEKIRNNEFIDDYFHYITVSEMKSNNENANEKLSEFAKKIDSKSSTSHFIDFLIYYFSNYDSDYNSIFSKFNFDFFQVKEMEFTIKYKNFFPFINDLLKQKYADFECEDFLLEIEQNPQKVFDCLIEKMPVDKFRSSNMLIYIYFHMQFAEQTSERFGKLSEWEMHAVIIYTRNNKSINITQKHVDLINDDYYKSQAQKILDSRNKQEHDTQNVQAKEIEGNKFNKFCEVIKLFFATLFSLGSIASIIVGVIALVSLLTLPFSPLILVGVGVSVLLVGGYFFYKSVKNLRNLSSMANEPNAKEEKSDDNSVIPQKNDKENNISEHEVQEEEEDKSEIDLNN